MFHFQEIGDHRSIENLELAILSMCHVVLSDKWSNTGMCSPYTRIYMILNGIGNLRCGEKTLEMTPGNIYIVPSGMSFDYSCKDGFEKIYFHIVLAYADKTDILSGIKDFITIENKSDDIAEVLKCKSCNTVFETVKIKAILQSIVSEAMQFIKEIPVKRQSGLVLEAIKYIDKNLNFCLSAEKIAESIFVSVHTLRKTFKAEVGIPIGKYINGRVVELAEKELRLTEKTVKEISYELGFCDQFYFSKRFVESYGISPQRYKKNRIII